MSPSVNPPANALMVKTAKGIAEVSSADHLLGPRLRTILLMVDGKLTFAELAARAATFGNAPAIVAHLLSEGFIEPQGTAAREPQPRTIHLQPSSLETGTDEATRHLVTELTRSGNLLTLRGDSLASMRENEAINPAKFFMRETISRLLGNGAVGVLDAINLATTREKLLAELSACCDIVRDLKGTDEADNFRISVLALLPE
ncbi:MAG: hypothetical protein JWN73_945 [Betaproteobacteria bacterium]|nr:hypothetical protein [Betaproteobacteria bacterium]